MVSAGRGVVIWQLSVHRRIDVKRFANLGVLVSARKATSATVALRIGELDTAKKPTLLTGNIGSGVSLESTGNCRARFLARCSGLGW